MSTLPARPDRRGRPELAHRLHRAFRLLQPRRDERAIRRRHHAAQLGGSDGHEGLLAVRVQAGPDARRRRVRRGDDERRRQLLVHRACPLPQAPTSTGSTSTTTPTRGWPIPRTRRSSLPDGIAVPLAARLQQGVRAVRRGEAELRASGRAPDRASARGLGQGHLELRADPSMPRLGGTIPRTLGVYLPPDYDANRAEPYKTIYMQHGGGQDQSDWMNMGNVPVIMDNLLQDGTTEPAVVITTNTNYLGPVGNQAVQGDAIPNLRNVVIPFVEANYNVSTARRSIAPSLVCRRAASSTQNLIRDDADLFGYYGPLERRRKRPRFHAEPRGPVHPLRRWRVGLRSSQPEHGRGARPVGFIENTVVSGAHDFNAWNQLFTIFATGLPVAAGGVHRRRDRHPEERRRRHEPEQGQPQRPDGQARPGIQARREG